MSLSGDWDGQIKEGQKAMWWRAEEVGKYILLVIATV